MAKERFSRASWDSVSVEGSLLPSPRERPLADVVIYDGQCRVCSDMVARLNRWDSRGRLAYLSLHDAEMAQRYPDLNHDDLMREIYLVDSDGARHRGVGALEEICRRVPRLRPLLPLFRLPGGARTLGWFYRLFARMRYRFGRTAACDDHTCQVHFGSRNQ
jgi:predicted DCC family thiol-disulfide oxidoreductase YuxK